MCAEYEQWTELGCRGEAVYLVDLQTGECRGRLMSDGPDCIQVPPDWWKDHLARVGAYVKDHVVP